MRELGKLEGCDRKAFDSWDFEKKAAAFKEIEISLKRRGLGR